MAGPGVPPPPPRALVAQNSAGEGPGRLAALLAADGYRIDVVRAWEAGPDGLASAAAQGCGIGGAGAGAGRSGRRDVLVVLGAPCSANDPLPHLRAEEEMIRGCVRSGVPVLGVCLGAQLIARAFGGAVRGGRAREAGYYGDLRPEGPEGRRMFAGMGDPFRALHLHGETFDLPEGAVRLARSGSYANQALRVGSAVGVQFHLEADGGTARRWLAAEAGLGGPAASLADACADAGAAEAEVARNMDAFYANWRAALGIGAGAAAGRRPDSGGGIQINHPAVAGP